jgi:predicted GNAT superfamily acetyltransferase
MSQITIRLLHSLDDFHRCVQIAREVWADAELDTEPHVTYVIADHTGGQVLGAFEGDAMVGFTKAYVGLHDNTPYLHSHMAAVLPSHRDRGIGRQLKLAQRENALRRNIRVIEWTFDPLETKNAHFNLNRLGGISRRYIPNFYGITTSPLHRGMPTDRLLVEWHLDSPRAIAAVNNLATDTSVCPAQIHLPNSILAASTAIPAAQGFSPEGVSSRSTPVALGESSSPPAATGHSERSLRSEESLFSSQIESTVAAQPEPTRSPLLALQSHLRSEFTQWFAKSYAATSVRRTSSGIDYCLSPYSDF